MAREGNPEVVERNLNAILKRGGDKFRWRLNVQVPALCRNTEMTPMQKYIRLVELADRAAKDIAPNAVCKKGCAACCHIAVGITEPEAKRIAEFTGKPYRQPPSMAHEDIIRSGKLSVRSAHELAEEARDEVVKKWTGTPCTFLGKDNECTIYEVRPIACRTYFNLSDDPTLCDVEHPENSVPNIDFGPSIHMAHILTHNPDESYGDIRDYFPVSGATK